jgi:hypothetical protein
LPFFFFFWEREKIWTKNRCLLQKASLRVNFLSLFYALKRKKQNQLFQREPACKKFDQWPLLPLFVALTRILQLLEKGAWCKLCKQQKSSQSQTSYSKNPDRRNNFLEKFFDLYTKNFSFFFKYRTSWVILTWKLVTV